MSAIITLCFTDVRWLLFRYYITSYNRALYCHLNVCYRIHVNVGLIFVHSHELSCRLGPSSIYNKYLKSVLYFNVHLLYLIFHRSLITPRLTQHRDIYYSPVHFQILTVPKRFLIENEGSRWNLYVYISADHCGSWTFFFWKKKEQNFGTHHK